MSKGRWVGEWGWWVGGVGLLGWNWLEGGVGR